MRSPFPRSWHPTRRAALLTLAALVGSACTGTPLPEPPDELPRPDWGARESVPPTLVSDAGLTPVTIRAARGVVLPETTVWAINLDSPASANAGPVQIVANAEGGFVLEVLASSGNRVRIVSRTPQRHSPPLDLTIILPPGQEPIIVHAPVIALPCFKVTPAETLVLEGRSAAVTLDNQCAVPVSITRAQLRLGDQGISLGTVPTEIAARTQIKLTLADSVGPSPTERLDILLLDVSASGTGSGKYAVDVFSGLE